MGQMKLNSDGSTLGNSGKAGGRGLIRDHQGNWIRGYAGRLGNTNSFITELQALRDGLAIAKELGINNLIVEMDALNAVMLMNNNSANLLMEHLLSDCRNLLNDIPSKRIVHTSQEVNQCADALARFGGSFVSSFVVFFYPSPMVVESLYANEEAVCCNKIVFSQFFNITQVYPKKKSCSQFLYLLKDLDSVKGKTLTVHEILE